MYYNISTYEFILVLFGIVAPDNEGVLLMSVLVSVCFCVVCWSKMLWVCFDFGLLLFYLAIKLKSLMCIGE